MSKGKLKAVPGGSKMPNPRLGHDGFTERREGSGTSIFDPVLCEIAYRWYCPPGGRILDPFAGGSVRGIVAAKLGRRYTGIDLSERQIVANREQAETILAKKDPKPRWVIGDSCAMPSLPGVETDAPFDLVFSCPPYGDLEVYSDDPADISTMPYDQFLKAYRAIIAHAIARLRDNRFALFVIGDFRGADGLYRGFIADTIHAFTDAGAGFYNEAVFIPPVASLPVRVRAQFESSRKLGKAHQNVVIFVKGDAKKAAEAIGDVEFGEPPQDEQIEEEAV